MKTKVGMLFCNLMFFSCKDASTDIDRNLSMQTGAVTYTQTEQIRVTLSNNSQQLLHLKPCCWGPDVRVQKNNEGTWETLDSACDLLACPWIDIPMKARELLSQTLGRLEPGHYRLVLSYSSRSTVEFSHTVFSNEFKVE